MCKIILTAEHYDHLIDAQNDPVHDSEELQEHMDKWDGNVFLNELNIGRKSTILEIGEVQVDWH